MSDVPSTPKRIQEQEVDFRSPISESTMYKLGGTMNFLLDNYAIPPGTIIDFAGPETAVPSGWIPCDGRAVSRTTYGNLFTNISTYWGVGDGVSTFNVPDLRGLFTRMQDATSNGAAGRDPEAGSRLPSGTGGSQDVGSNQGDQFRQHQHFIVNTGGSYGPGTFASPAGSAGQQFTDYQGGTETRPKNAYVLKIIKT